MMKRIPVLFSLMLLVAASFGQKSSSYFTFKFGIGYGVGLNQKVPEKIGGVDLFLNKRSIALPVVVAADFHLNKNWTIGAAFRNFNQWQVDKNYYSAMTQRYDGYQAYYDVSSLEDANESINLDAHALYITLARRMDWGKYELVNEIGIGVRNVFHPVYDFKVRDPNKNEFTHWKIRPTFSLSPTFETSCFIRHKKIERLALGLNFMSGPSKFEYRAEILDNQKLVQAHEFAFTTWMNSLSLQVILWLDTKKRH